MKLEFHSIGLFSWAYIIPTFNLRLSIILLSQVSTFESLSEACTRYQHGFPIFSIRLTTEFRLLYHGYVTVRCEQGVDFVRQLVMQTRVLWIIYRSRIFLSLFYLQNQDLFGSSCYLNFKSSIQFDVMLMVHNLNFGGSLSNSFIHFIIYRICHEPVTFRKIIKF